MIYPPVSDRLLSKQATISMLDIAQLAAFVAVVRAKSFTCAAEALSTDKAHVSRLVSRLEATLGAQLLTRSTRALAVTEIGREMFERAVGILAAIEEAEGAVAHAQSAPSGVLKLTCGEEFGYFVVSQWMIAFQNTYTATRIEATFTNRVVDLIHEGFDLSIRVGALSDSGLSARKLGEISYALYASPGYLRKRGTPKRIEDLNAKHDFLAFTGGGGVAPLVNGDESFAPTQTPRLAADNSAFLRKAAADGLGITLAPRFQAAPLVTAGRLREVLPGWTRPPVPVHAVFPSSRFLTPKVRAFVDLAKARFESALANISL